MRVPVKASDAVIARAVTPRACRLIIHWCGISRPTVLMCSAPRLPTLKPQQLTGQRLPGIPPGLPRRRRQARITAVGAYVTITGAEPAAYNGTVQVLSAPTATSFTFTPVSVPSGNATKQGTVGAADKSAVALPVKSLKCRRVTAKPWLTIRLRALLHGTTAETLQ